MIALKGTDGRIGNHARLGQTRRGLLGLALGLLVLGGCTTRSVEGRVISGRASLATVADPADDRMDTESDEATGIEGAEIVAVSLGGSIIGSATSDADGIFKLKLPIRFGDRATIQAEAEGFVRCSSELYPPGDGRRILVVLQPLR